MNGIVIVDKPAGFTSHDAVRKVRKVLGVRKAGHTGTLDPLATGVLPVCVGEATKLVPFLVTDEKTYEVVMRLGLRTDTQDVTGRVLRETEPQVSEEDVLAALKAFAGPIMQVPPAYSAVKVGGKALYRWARKGVTVEVPARPVEIREITPTACSLPRVGFTVTCSKGTYVRTLCADVGERLGCGAVLEALRRTRSGDFVQQEAVSIEADTTEVRRRLEENLIPMTRALRAVPALVVDAALEARIARGWQPDREGLPEGQFPSLEQGDVIKFLSETGRLVALGRVLAPTAEWASLQPGVQAVRIARVFNATN